MKCGSELILIQAMGSMLILMGDFTKVAHQRRKLFTFAFLQNGKYKYLIWIEENNSAFSHCTTEFLLCLWYHSNSIHIIIISLIYETNFYFTWINLHSEEDSIRLKPPHATKPQVVMKNSIPCATSILNACGMKTEWWHSQIQKLIFFWRSNFLITPSHTYRYFICTVTHYCTSSVRRDMWQITTTSFALKPNHVVIK